jgi:hypothetical protein
MQVSIQRLNDAKAYGEFGDEKGALPPISPDSDAALSMFGSVGSPNINVFDVNCGILTL